MSDSRDDFFARLFSESREALHRYVQRLVGSAATAEEIVQESFLRTYRQSRSVETPRAFLFSVARNLASKQRRHERTAKTDSVADFETLRIVGQHAPLDEGLLADEQTRILQEAVGRLPPQCRAAFTLKVFYACSYQEIADRLGISPKTVEKHIARGSRETHAYLRRRYRDSGNDHG